MQPGDSLACAQEPTTGIWPEPDESSSHFTIQFLENRFKIMLPCIPVFFMQSLSFMFLHQTPAQSHEHYVTCPFCD
jgi:hypothetical protein